MKLKFSEDGLRSKKRELEKLEKELHENRIYKNKIAVENGNVWHDNNDFEQCEVEERRLMKKISDLKDEILNAEIISPTNCDLQKVDYGAIVTLRIMGADFMDELTVLFSDSDEKSNYEKISLNSPVGKIIYTQKAGFSGKYTVGASEMLVEVVEVEYDPEKIKN